MDNRPTSRRFLLFAAGALLAIAAAATVVTFFQLRAIGNRAEQDASEAAIRTLGPLLADTTTPAAFVQAGSVLLGDDIRALRLWSEDGTLLAAAGEAADEAPDGATLSRASGGDVTGARLTSSGPGLLASFAPLSEGAVLEIQQPYGPIGNAIASGRLEFILVMAGANLTLWIVLLPILWAAARGRENEYNRLLYLYRTGEAIRSSLEITDVLGQLVRDAAVYARAQLSIATLLEEKSNDLVLLASFDGATGTAGQHHRKVEEWFLRRCAATAQTVTAEQDSFPYRALLGYERDWEEPVNILCLPVSGPEHALGVITVVRPKEEGAFTSPETQVLEEMASQAAVAVEQASLFAKVRGHASQVEMSYDTTLKVLMAALDTKDHAQEGHSERVTKLTVAMARELGLPPEKLPDIERGALLHDVGKIGVPDDILRKEGGLNAKEWEAMQKHPLLAGLMVSKVGFLEGALPILLYHHERYDGSGYPFGLVGDAIPLEARIFAVVDAFDAMTSDRPYRNAMPREQALQEIKRNAEIQFDPGVVEAFLRVIARVQPMTRAA